MPDRFYWPFSPSLCLSTLLPRSCFVVSVLPCLMVPALAQQQCNNTGKAVAVIAGDHNFTNATCNAFSVSIAGVTVSGPPSCIRGGAHYAGTVYQCQGVANLTNCTNRGYKVNITTYTDGGCADLTGLLPGASFSSWAKVPNAVRKALKCVAPKKKETFDWSASTADCPTGAKVTPAVGQIKQGANGSSYIVAQGPVYGTVGTANPFLTGYDLAQSSSPSVVQGTLGAAVVLLHPRLAGVAVSATVEVEHWLGGRLDGSYSAALQGSVLANGRFDVALSTPVEHEGKLVSGTKRVSFDGVALSCLWAESENGNIWDAAGASFGTRFARETSEIGEIFAWTRDPFGVPWFAEIEYTELSAASTIMIQQRLSPELGGGVDKEYEIDMSGPVPHPVATRIFDLAGQLREEVAFSDYRTLSPGVWRPFKVVRTTWLAPGTSTDHIVVTTKLSSAKVLKMAEQAAVPAASADAQIWFHWLE